MPILARALLVACAFMLVAACVSVVLVHFIRRRVWLSDVGLHSRFWFFTETVPLADITQVFALYRYWDQGQNSIVLGSDWAVFYWSKAGMPHQLGRQMFAKRFMHPGSSAGKVQDRFSDADRTYLAKEANGGDMLRKYAAIELEMMTIDHLEATPAFQLARALHDKLPLRQGTATLPDWAKTETAGPFGGGMSGSRIPFAYWSFDGTAGLIPKSAAALQFRSVGDSDDD